MPTAPCHVRKIFGKRTAQLSVPACVLAIALIGLLGSSAHAQDTARDFVEPRLTRAQFAAFTRPLGLDSDQRALTEMIFSDYSSALDDLTKSLEQDAMDAGLRDVQDALAGRGRLSADELRSKRAAVLRVYQKGWPVVDDALDTLIAGVQHVLTTSQAAGFEVLVRELHRSLWLHPRQADREYQEYAGDGVDVLLLAETALAEGGELHALGRGAIANILYGYELELDALLLQTAPEYRNAKLLRRIAVVEKDSASLRDLDQLSLARWKRLYQLNLSAVEQIGQIAASNLGEQVKQHWLDRFDQANFAWLYPRRKPDRQIEWIRLQTLTPEVRAQADANYEHYLSKRRELSRKAIDIMLQARLEFQTMLYSMMDPASIDDRLRRGLYEELLKNSGEQANLESTTSAAMEALLDPAMRDSLRKAMQGPDRRR